MARSEDSERFDDGKTGRGRTKEKGKEIESNGALLTRVSRERSTLRKLGDIFESESDMHPGDGWKEFKKGNRT